MPMMTIKCRTCGAAISGENFPQRMAKLRRHYKAKHPKKFKESIRRGVKARAKARREG